jgi:hypothetical protein
MEDKEKMEWSSPELYVLDFKKTSGGFVEDEPEDEGFNEFSE